MTSAVALLRQTTRQPVRMSLVALGAFTFLAVVALLLPVSPAKFLILIGSVVGLVGSVLCLALIGLGRVIGLEGRANRVVQEGASRAIIPVRPFSKRGPASAPAAGVHPRRPTTSSTGQAQQARGVGAGTPAVDVRTTAGVDLRETKIPAESKSAGRLKISD